MVTKNLTEIGSCRASTQELACIVQRKDFGRASVSPVVSTADVGERLAVGNDRFVAV
ncbi:MAG: hypothetical protein GY948_05520 [Alphaproteobacteria bacterium]|nr:hypothetical protein [Alphaproteobacteria bacterium]